VQKLTAELAITATLADNTAGVMAGVAHLVVTSGAPLNLASSSTLTQVLAGTSASPATQAAIAQANAAVNASLSLTQIAAVEQQAIDAVAPTVSSFSPADAATSVAVGSNIVVTFSEAVQFGAGNIVLKTAAGAIVATYTAGASANLSISGAALTINPSADLAVGTHYGVEFAAGSIKDLAGNAYAGTTSYDFTTVGVTSGVTGTNGDDLLQGTSGNDTITTGLGNDTVNAGAGVDTVILPMFPNVYSLAESTPGHVTGHYAGYSLNLNDVETVQFGTSFQTTLPLSTLVSGAAQLQLGRLTDLYLAFFGRARMSPAWSTGRNS